MRSAARNHQNRIAFFLPSLRGDGAERVVLTLATGFAEKGVLVDLVLTQKVGTLLTQVPPNVRIVDLGKSRVLYSIPGLAEYLRINRPQVLLSAMGHANLAAIVAKLLAHHKLRLAISLHSTMGKVEGKKGAERTVLKYLLKVLNRYADEIIAVSQGVADDYASCMSLEKDRIKVIFNPAVSPEIFRKAETLPCHKWFTPKDGPVVLAVGRLTRAKDYPTLVKAFRIVRRKINARLIILGEGEERTAIERLIQTEGLANSVSMPGYMENPFSFMRHADVFVLSSKWEGFGMVLAEAMALGTPVVSTDCPGGPAEILAGGRWGKLVPVGDTQSLAHAIIETVRNPVRDAAIERACAFSTEAILHEYAHALHIEI